MLIVCFLPESSVALVTVVSSNTLLTTDLRAKYSRTIYMSVTKFRLSSAVIRES